jgi:hypothetical protein
MSFELFWNWALTTLAGKDYFREFTNTKLVNLTFKTLVKLVVINVELSFHSCPLDSHLLMLVASAEKIASLTTHSDHCISIMSAVSWCYLFLSFHLSTFLAFSSSPSFLSLSLLWQHSCFPTVAAFWRLLNMAPSLFFFVFHYFITSLLGSLFHCFNCYVKSLFHGVIALLLCFAISFDCLVVLSFLFPSFGISFFNWIFGKRMHDL